MHSVSEYCWDKECSRIEKGTSRDSDGKWGAGQGPEEGHSGMSRAALRCGVVPGHVWECKAADGGVL